MPKGQGRRGVKSKKMKDLEEQLARSTEEVRMANEAREAAERRADASCRTSSRLTGELGAQNRPPDPGGTVLPQSRPLPARQSSLPGTLPADGRPPGGRPPDESRRVSLTAATSLQSRTPKIGPDPSANPNGVSGPDPGQSQFQAVPGAAPPISLQDMMQCANPLTSTAQTGLPVGAQDQNQTLYVGQDPNGTSYPQLSLLDPVAGSGLEWDSVGLQVSNLQLEAVANPAPFETAEERRWREKYEKLTVQYAEDRKRMNYRSDVYDQHVRTIEGERLDALAQIKEYENTVGTRANLLQELDRLQTEVNQWKSRPPPQAAHEDSWQANVDDWAGEKRAEDVALRTNRLSSRPEFMSRPLTGSGPPTVGTMSVANQQLSAVPSTAGTQQSQPVSLAVTFSQDVRHQQSVRPAVAAVQTSQLSTAAVPFRSTVAVPTSQPIPVQRFPNLPSIPSTSVQPPLRLPSQRLPAAPPARTTAGYQPRLQSRPIGGTVQSRPLGGVPQLQPRPPAQPNVQAPVGAPQQQITVADSSSTGYPVTRVIEIPHHQGAIGMNVTIANRTPHLMLI